MEVAEEEAEVVAEVEEAEAEEAGAEAGIKWWQVWTYQTPTGSSPGMRCALSEMLVSGRTLWMPVRAPRGEGPMRSATGTYQTSGPRSQRYKEVCEPQVKQ